MEHNEMRLGYHGVQHYDFMPKAKGVGAGKEINFFQSALMYFEKR